jgi:hypothetical protein
MMAGLHGVWRDQSIDRHALHVIFVGVSSGLCAFVVFDFQI